MRNGAGIRLPGSGGVSGYDWKRPGRDPLLRTCRTVVRYGRLPAETARKCLIEGHGIRPRWCRSWVSRPQAKAPEPRNSGYNAPYPADNVGSIRLLDGAPRM